MKIYGLTGNIGTGKSTVAGILENLGANIIDADKIAREIVKPGSPAWKQIVGHFGEKVLNPDRTINRKELGRIVFRNKKELEKLNSFTHPYILEEIRKLISESEKNGIDITVIEAALIKKESQLGRLLDGIIVVSAETDKQVERITKRDQVSREEAFSRIQSQVPETEKKRGADFIINNSSDLKQLEKEASALWKKLTDS